MAYSFMLYTGDGSTTIFTIPFPYLDKSHVLVSVNGVSKSTPADFTFPSPTQIQFGVAPANGASVAIRRSSSRSARLVNFQNGAKLTKTVLNLDADQSFYVTQEAFDAADEDKLKLDANGRWDANNRRIINLAEPSGSSDAATKSYIDAAITDLPVADDGSGNASIGGKKVTNLAAGTASTDAVNKAQLDALVLAAGNVPTPANPADNNKVLTAGSGTWAWQAANFLPLNGGTISSGNVTISSGRLAIGSALGTIGTSGQAELYSATGVETRLLMAQLGITNYSLVIPANTNALCIYGSTTERVRLSSDGNLAVGSTNPKVRLQASGPTDGSPVPTLGTASGSFYVTGLNPDFGILSGVTSAGTGWLQCQRTDGVGTSYDLALQPSGSGVVIGTGNASGYKLAVGGGLTSCAVAWNYATTQKAWIGLSSHFGTATAGTDFQTRLDGGGSLVWGFTGTEQMRLSPDGNLKTNCGTGSLLNSYQCRAWANFNGTGTVAARASGNVSSITDNGVGDYSVNFTTALPDANYCATITPSGGGSLYYANNLTYAAGSLSFQTRDAGGNLTDVSYVNVAIHR